MKRFMFAVAVAALLFGFASCVNDASGGSDTPASVAVTGITVTSPTGESTGSILKDGTLQLTAAVTPDNASNKTVTWTSSAEDVATVNSDGLVTGVKVSAEAVTITASAGDGSGVTGTFSLTVTDASVPVTSITVTAAGNAVSVENGKTLQLSAEIAPSTATNTAVTWSSSDETSATVDSTGLVTAKAVTAKVTITATAADGSGVKGTIDLAVTKAATSSVSVSAVTVTAAGNAVSVENGKTLQLSAAVTPDNATNKAVTWSSSDETSATVDSTGLVTAKAVTAKVTITATAADGSGVKGTIDLAVTAAASTETVAEKTMKAYGIMFTPSTGVGGAWINLTAEWNDAANAITESGLITDNMTIDSMTYTGPVGVATAGTMTQKWGLGFNSAGFTATGSHVLSFEISWKSSLYKVAVTFDGKNDTSDSPFNVTDETITEVTQAEQVAAEKVVLKAAIDSAQTEHDNATEGTAAGNYKTGSKATFQTAIDAATAVYNDTAATVATVKQAETNLASAEKTFKASVVVPSTVPDWTSSIHCNDNGAWFFYMLTWKDDSDAVAIADMDLTTNKPAITGGFTAGYSNAVDVSSVDTATKTAKWGMGINGAGYHTATPCTLTCYVAHDNVTYKVETVFTDDATDHSVAHDMTIVSTTVTAVQ